MKLFLAITLMLLVALIAGYGVGVADVPPTIMLIQADPAVIHEPLHDEYIEMQSLPWCIECDRARDV